MDNTFLYFGYASNLLKERLLVGVPNPRMEFVGPGKLKGYSLTFTRAWEWPGTWYGPGANIKPDPSGHVWGAVWRIGNEHREDLERQESSHGGEEVEVELEGGERLRCFVFRLKEGVEGEPPSPQYKDVFVRGAKQSGLPPDYIAKLEALPHSGYAGPLPLYDQVLQALGEK